MTEQPSPENSRDEHYVVIARRYRPGTFAELIGQSQVVTALSNAIAKSRVGHAYLFSGARGVGKTSAARIFAKCLNCQTGPTTTPCGECDSCQCIAAGEDVDVIEIDGASNRGIDEIRQLRSNAIVCPSRSKYKIYIIDEVHMLTLQAFNALLKTLEEPPEHVKFIFCTTDPEKIPITVLSRCQRFDFAPVETGSIVDRLKEIVVAEGRAADDEALALLAKRAGGSMRDSQSLLEQLLAFGSESLSVADVHQLLGTADARIVGELVQALADRNSAIALALIENAKSTGVDAGQLAEQLLSYLRDVMAAAAGCSGDMMMIVPLNDFDDAQNLGKAIGIETLLAMVQILDQALVRMRYSAHSRILLEIAVVRICNLENLDQITTLLYQLKSGQPIAPGEPGTPVTSRATPTAIPAPSRSDVPQASSKKNEPVDKPQVDSAATSEVPKSSVATSAAAVDQRDEVSGVTESNVRDIWLKSLDRLADITSDAARSFTHLQIAGDNRLIVTIEDEYKKNVCQRSERRERLEQEFSRVAGGNWRIDFVVSETVTPEPKPQPVVSRRKRQRDLERHPLVQKTKEIFDADIVDFRQPR